MDTDQLDFGFVTDDRVRLILDDFSAQAAKSLATGCYLGAVVAYGAVVEGLLTWVLLQREADAMGSRKAPRDGSTKEIKPLHEWHLTALILVARELELLGTVAEQAAWAVKDFRNLIHPYKLVRQSARPDESLATSAREALRQIRRSVRGNLAT